MHIIEKVDDKNMLRIMVDSNEESLFSLLKAYIQEDADVDLVGMYKEHHLVDKTEFFMKTKKGSAMDLFKKSLKIIKKDLQTKKLK